MTKKRIDNIIEKTIRLSSEERPELKEMTTIYKKFMRDNNIASKEDTDIFIYEKMYGILPNKKSEYIKIRFWRTGLHMPANREQANMFIKALGTDENTKKFLLMEYMDRCDRAFSKMQKDDNLYRERMNLMNNMIDEYLMKIHPSFLLEQSINQKNVRKSLRHIYYMDCHSLVGNHQNNKSCRMDSISYGTELLKNINLIGEIPRKTMIRHIIVMCRPFISREIIDKYLIGFGYAPLKPEHTLISGERFDYMIINIMELYSRECTGLSYSDCMRWLNEAFLYIDEVLVQRKNNSLRPIYYKALEIR